MNRIIRTYLFCMFCSLSLMAEDKAFYYSIDSIAPWNLKFEESKRIGLTWLDFGDYANAYYYLTSAYDQDGADADVRVGLDRASYYMNRKSFVSTYQKKQSVYAECSWLHQSHECSGNADYISSGGYNLKDGISLRGAYDRNINQRLSVSQSIGITKQGYISLFDVGEENLFSDELDAHTFDYGTEANLLHRNGWRFSVFGKIMVSKQEVSVYDFDSIAYANDQQNSSSTVDPMPIWNPWYNNGNTNPWSGFYNNNWYNNFYNGWSYNPYSYGFGYWNSYYDYFYREYMKYYQSQQYNEKDYREQLLKYYTNEKKSDKRFSFILGASVGKYYKHHDFLFRSSFMRSPMYNVVQIGAYYVWYPKGDLSLYVQGKIIYLWRKEKNKTETIGLEDLRNKKISKCPIFEASVGRRMLPYLWLKGSFLYGDLRGSEDCGVNVVYLLSDGTRFRCSAQVIVPLQNSWNVYVTYRITNRMATVSSFDVNAFYLASENVYDHVLSMGVKWEF